MRGADSNVESDGAEALNDFWSIQGDFIYRHHNEPRVQLYVPKEKTFPIPLKYIDVTRSSDTNLDGLQEKRIDDYWNVNVNRSLSDSWTGFTKFTLLKEKPPKGYSWSKKRLTKFKQRPDLKMCGLKSGRRSEKPLRKERNKSGQTRSPNSIMIGDRGIYFIDPDDGDYKDTIKKREKKVGSSYGGANALQERNEKSSKLIGDGSENC